jgi:transketolase
MEDATRSFLISKAKEIRKLTIETIGFLGVGHIGGALSIVDLLTLLYYRHMRIDPADPARQDRDRLVLSKGHAGPALYSILADLGFFPREWLHSLNRGGTRLPSHCDMNLTPGVDMTTGSLGQGLSVAVGMALGIRLDGLPGTVYAVLGDGDLNEGQTWEAAMAAGHFRLEKLIAFCDCNRLQIDGETRAIMDTEDLAAKWKAFNWHVWRVNGHELEPMDRAIGQARQASGRPSMIVLDTVKGKGAFFCEGRAESHNMSFDMKTAREAIARLEDGR